jgi:hypothetical protein
MEVGDASMLPGGGGVTELEVGVVRGGADVITGCRRRLGIGQATGHYLSRRQVAPKEKEEKEWWSKVEAKPTDRRAVRPIAPPIA